MEQTERRPSAAHDPLRKRCAHLRYQVTCAEMDRLREETQDRCALCDLAAEETPHDWLHIDHDAAVGEWAVRGLLCSYCNTQLDSNVGNLDSNRVASYLNNPWYVRLLAEYGLSPNLPPEPPLGTVVELPHRAAVERTDAGWTRIRGRRGGAAISSWSGLHERFGPHRMRLVEKAAPTPPAPMGAQELRAAVSDAEAVHERLRMQRDAKLLRACDEGWSQADVARITGYSRETVRQAIRRAAAKKGQGTS